MTLIEIRQNLKVTDVSNPFLYSKSNNNEGHMGDINPTTERPPDLLVSTTYTTSPNHLINLQNPKTPSHMVSPPRIVCTWLIITVSKARTR
jgi:hypothetical protein